MARQLSCKWLLVLGSAICFFMADGCSYSFGTFYSELSQVFESRVLIALLSGLLFGVPQIFGPIVCPLISVLGDPISCLLGCILVSSSFILASFVHSVSLLLLIIGLFTSFGLELLYATALVAVLNNFERHRGLATGLTVFGGGLGTIAFSQIYPSLEQLYMWRGAMFVEGAIIANCLISVCLFRLVETAKTSEEKTVETSGSSSARSEELRLVSRRDSQRSDGLDEQALAVVWAAKQASPDVSIEERNRLTGTLTESVGDSLVLQLQSCSQHDLHKPESSSCQQQMHRLQSEFRTSFAAMMDRKLWTARFVFFCFLNLLIGAAILQPWIFIFDFALGQGLPMASANHILSFMGISYAAGQIIFGLLADFCNAYLLFDLCVSVSGVVCFGIGYAVMLPALMLLGMVFALAMGGLMALYSLILVDLVGESRLYPAFGVYLPFVGVGNLIGSLLSAWASDLSSYSLMFKGGGAALVFLSAAILPFLIRPLRHFGVRSVNRKTTD